MPEAINIEKAVRNLCDVNLFSELDPQQLEKVAAICQLLPVSEGQTLIIEGDESECVYILLRGEVSVVRSLDLPVISSMKGTERILTRITSEGTPLVGETALLGSGKRQSSVRCVTDCMFYRIDASDLLGLINADARIGLTIYRQLAELLHRRLNATSNDVVKLSAALVLALEG